MRRPIPSGRRSRNDAAEISMPFEAKPEKDWLRPRSSKSKPEDALSR
jgi:hypothetical protein